MKQYTLITRLPKGVTQSVNFNSSESVSAVDDMMGVKKSPFEDLLEYNPDTNKIDSLLHQNILEPEELKDIRITYSGK
jgi:hypothetical protein